MEASVEEIMRRLAVLEKESGVTVLYACEAGSRAWGMDSPDSDYDVRFIYVQPLEWYLSVQQQRDVIEDCGPIYDFAGWELRKALALLRKSNPALLEWLHSPTVYREDGPLRVQLADIASKYSSGAACIYHYHHMAKNNFREFISGERVKLKKYLYVMRPLMAVQWIREGRGWPVPVRIADLLAVLENHAEVKDEMLSLLDRKRGGNELAEGPAVPILNRYIEAALADVDDAVRRVGWMESYAGSKVPYAKLDQVLREAVLSQTLES